MFVASCSVSASTPAKADAASPPGGGALASAIRRPRERAETVSVRVCPHCAEELPDEATVCSGCHKDPTVAPAWAAPRSDEPSPRLGDVFGPNRVLPTSDRVPAPYERLEPGRALGEVPSTVWLSLILWLFGGVVFFGLFAITGPRRRDRRSGDRADPRDRRSQPDQVLERAARRTRPGQHRDRASPRLAHPAPVLDRPASADLARALTGRQALPRA